MRDRQRRESGAGDVHDDSLGSAGKRTLTERAYAGGGAAGSSDVAPVQLKAAAPATGEDPFGTHLIGSGPDPSSYDEAEDMETISDEDYRSVVGDHIYEKTKHLSPAQRLAWIKEEEYRQTVGDDFYEKTKDMNDAQRKAAIEEEEYRQTVGDEVYEKTKNMTKAQRRAFLKNMERELRAKAKKKGKKKPPKQPAPAVPAPSGPALVGTDPNVS